MISITEAQYKAACSTATFCRDTLDQLDEQLAAWDKAGPRGYASMPAECYDGSPLLVRHNFACQAAYDKLLQAKAAMQECLRQLSEPEYSSHQEHN